MNNWIPTKKKLPKFSDAQVLFDGESTTEFFLRKESDKCLITFMDGKVETATYSQVTRFSSGCAICVTDYWNLEYDQELMPEQVFAWMPLPDPYEVE